MNWYRLNGGSLTGPFGYYSREVRDATRASNPEVLDLREYGFIPEWRESVDALLGWEPAVIETRDGVQVACVYAVGSIEERQATALIQWRESMSIPRWKGRAYLASQPRFEVGPLATFSGATLLDQIDALVASSFGPVQRERYLGADPWRRNDAMIAGMGTLLGLSDEQIDDWFKSAESFA